MLLSRCPERIVPVFVLVICMLVWWWRGQAGVGLGELRSPAVRNLLVFFVVVVVALVGLPGFAVMAHRLGRLRAWNRGQSGSLW